MVGLVLVLLVSLCACSSSSAKQNSSGGGMAAYDTAAEAPMSAPSVASSEDYYYEESEADYGGTTSAEEAGFAGGEGLVTDGRKITFSASITINTKNFNSDYKAIISLITQYGGYVSNENFSDYTSYGRNEGRSSWISIRVPADGYNSFLDGLSGIGETTNLSRGSEDLTSQYFDTEARIEMLELRKDRLMRYLVEAEDAADIVEFERELSNVLYELDQYKGNKRYLDQLVDYASVDVSITELITPETIGKDGEPLGDRASNAFGLSLDNVVRFLEGAAVFLAAAAPVIALIVVILLIVWLIFRITRKSREKSRVKREEKHAKQQAERMAMIQRVNAEAYYGQYTQPQSPQMPPAPQPTPTIEPQPAPAPEPLPVPAPAPEPEKKDQKKK